MTMAVLDSAPATGAAGRVTGEHRDHPDPEVPERARRRTFTVQYKLDILAAYDAAGPGEKGAILRREGLYSSHIVDWRPPRDTGALAGRPVPRGRPAADPRDAQIARLRKEKAELEQPLRRRLDGRHPRIRRPGREADRRDLRETGHHPAGSSPSTPTAARR